jgi:hypothetical protein
LPRRLSDAAASEVRELVPVDRLTHGAQPADGGVDLGAADAELVFGVEPVELTGEALEDLGGVKRARSRG